MDQGIGLLANQRHGKQAEYDNSQARNRILAGQSLGFAGGGDNFR